MRGRRATTMLAAAAVMLAVVLQLFGGTTAAAAPASVPRHVVVVGIPDLGWQDVSPARTPNLWRLAQRGAVGALSVHAVGFATSCAKGWLTLSAGNRAATGDVDEDRDRPCGDRLRHLLEPRTWRYLRAQNKATGFSASIGSLGYALERAGRRLGAAGDTGTSLALADRTGTAPALVALPDALRADVAVVGDSRLHGVDDASRPAAVADVDAGIGAIVEAVDPSTDLLIAGVSDHFHGQPHLRVAIAVGPSFRAGLLSSASTGRTPFLQLIDLAPTVLSSAGVPRPGAMVGRPWFRSGPRTGSLAATVDHFVDLDDAARAATVTGRSFKTIYAVALTVFFLAAAVIVRRRRRGRSAAIIGVIGLGVAWLPQATFVAQLSRWWEAGGGRFYLVIDIVCVVGAAVALFASRRLDAVAAVAVVAWTTALLFFADTATGGRLQISAMFGDSPLVAGRFHGVGNVDFALISTSTLLSAGCAGYVLRRRGRRRAAVVAMVGILLLGIAIDAAPQLGDDLGGALSLTPAALVLLALAGSWLLSWRRAVVAAVIAAVPALGVALYDYSLPEHRQSHIGRFVGQVLHGGAFTVVRRKAIDNFHQLRNPSLLIPLIAAVILVVVISTDLRAATQTAREVRAAFVAVAVVAVLGGALNDSGAAIPVAIAAVAASLAVWVSLTPATPAGTSPTGAPRSG